jgi:hypothetical protein
MTSSDLIIKLSNRVFCQRVAFMAMKVAQQKASDSPEDLNAMAYAEHIFRGGENASLLALHVAAASQPVTTALEESVDAVRDEDIEAALLSIWGKRAAAFGATSMQVRKVQELVAEVTRSAETAQAAVTEARNLMPKIGGASKDGGKPKT